MNSYATDTDVLIVGAGPVGLFLANECARRGLRWRLIEARSSQSEHSKALAIFPRTFEIFDMAGLVQPFLEVANRVTWVAVVSHRRQMARIRFTPEGKCHSVIPRTQAMGSSLGIARRHTEVVAKFYENIGGLP